MVSLQRLGCFALEDRSLPCTSYCSGVSRGVCWVRSMCRMLRLHCLAANYHMSQMFEVTGACLVPAVALRVRLADLAVQAVGVGRHDNLGHQRRKPLAVVGLGRCQGHCAKCPPMEGVLHGQVMQD